MHSQSLFDIASYYRQTQEIARYLETETVESWKFLNTESINQNEM